MISHTAVIQVHYETNVRNVIEFISSVLSESNQKLNNHQNLKEKMLKQHKTCHLMG